MICVCAGSPGWMINVAGGNAYGECMSGVVLAAAKLISCKAERWCISRFNITSVHVALGNYHAGNESWTTLVDRFVHRPSMCEKLVLLSRPRDTEASVGTSLDKIMPQTHMPRAVIDSGPNDNWMAGHHHPLTHTSVASLHALPDASLNHAYTRRAVRWRSVHEHRLESERTSHAFLPARNYAHLHTATSG